MRANTENVLIIAKKELKSYFDSPTAYIVLVVFLLLWEYLFFRNAFLVGEASLRSFFAILPWLFLFLAPALTMGSISQEKSEGTLEVLLTHSVRDVELVTGKFIGSVIFVGIGLLFTVPIAYSFSQYGSLDWGVVVGQYLGALFMAAVLISLGVFISSLFSNQIASMLTAAGASFLLVVVGFELVAASLPLQLAPLLNGLSVTSHFDSMARGVIDVRDVWYFFSITVVFLGLAYLQMLRRRFGNRREQYRAYQVGMILFVSIAIATNIIGSRIPGRLDLTRNNRYTLSQQTKQTLSQLPDVVNVSLFASGRLPAQLQPTLRDVKDVLRDYDVFGGDNLVVVRKDPQADPAAGREAQSLGVQAVRFNVVGQEELQVQNGYLGIAVSYAGSSEAIPFIPDTSKLEYQLTSIIRQLTATEKPKVAFLSGHGEKGPFTGFQAFDQELRKQFDVETVTLDEENVTVSDDVSVLVIAGPTQEIDEAARSAVHSYIEQGGSVLFLADGVTIDPQVFSAAPAEHNAAQLLADLGVTVQTDLVYDLRSHDTVSFDGGLVNFVLPYPLWPRAQVAEESTAAADGVETVLVPWASSVRVDENKVQEAGYTASELLVTTMFGGTQKSTYVIAPDQQFSQENLGKQVVAVKLEKGNNRIVVVGDSDFLTDQFVKNSAENLSFGIAVISWLSKQESLADIRVKQAVERKLLFRSASQIAFVKYGNMALVALGLPAIGAWRFMRRRKRSQLTYESRTDKH